MANIRVAAFYDYINLRVTFIIRNVTATTGVSRGAIVKDAINPADSDYEQMVNSSDNGGGKQITYNLAGLTTAELSTYRFWYKDDLIEGRLAEIRAIFNNTLSPPLFKLVTPWFPNPFGFETRGGNADVIGLYKASSQFPTPIINSEGQPIDLKYLPFQIKSGSKTNTGTSSDRLSQAAFPNDIVAFDNNDPFILRSAFANEAILETLVTRAEAAQALIASVQSKTDVTTSGGSDGTINLNVSWNAAYASPTYLWSDGATTKNRTGLSSGSYSVVITVPETISADNVTYLEQTRLLSVSIDEPAAIPNLDATLTGTNITATGGSDGTLNANVTAGSGNYTYAWTDDGAVTTPTRTGVIAGDYEVTITDITTAQVLVLTITLTEPAVVEIPVDPYFEVPKMQSLHFIKEELIDNTSIWANLDNQLICDQVNLGYTKELYLQKVAQRDNITIQVRSTSDDFQGQLIDIDGNVVLTSIPVLKRNLINVPTNFSVNINSNFIVSTGIGFGQSRVYFIGESNSPLTNGDTFEITASAKGITGNYEVVSIGYDESRQQEYAVINLDYTPYTGDDIATIFYNDNLVPFDIYELDFSFGGVGFGNYYIKIESNDIGIIYNSEPISVKSSHKKTQYITWTNTDNAYEIDYTTGIIHRARIEASFFERIPSAIRDTLRNTNNSLSVLSSKPIRKLRMKTIGLPPYLHEKLSILFEHDSIFVQGQQFVTDEGYGEPTYLDRSYKANSEIVLEQVGWLDNTYNGDDLRGIDEEDSLLIINEGFLKL